MTRLPLIIPSETQVREFDAKLLLACVAAERGFRSVVGSRIAIHLAADSFEPGIYLAKDIKRSSNRMFRILRGLGHRIVSCDEEGLILLSAEHYWDTRIDRDTLAMVDAQMTWGQAEADILARYPDHPGIPIHVTGNARADLMRPEFRGFFDEEVAGIQRRFGRPLLLNTNFALVNPYFDTLHKHSAATLAEKNPTSRFANADLRTFRADLFERIRALVPHLSARFPDSQIIVRPHPGESSQAWEDAAAGCSNVHVVFEGAVVPWLLACAALVHNGCTTSVEAGILGVPAIAYEPVTSELYAEDIANRLSRSVASDEELFDALAPLLAANDTSSESIARNVPELRRQLEHHLASLEGQPACDRVVDILETIEPAPVPPAGERLGARVHARGRAITKRAKSYLPRNKNSAAYTKHRFPGITEPEVRERIARLAAASGRFAKVRATELEENVFEIRG